MKKEYLVCDNCGFEMFNLDDVRKAIQIISDDNKPIVIKLVINEKINYIKEKSGSLEFCSMSCFNKFLEKLAGGNVGNSVKVKSVRLNE